MNTITLHLPPHIIHRLEEEAQRTGRQAVEVAETILAGQLAPAPTDERERAIRALKDAGMLSELSDEMVGLAEKLRREANASSLTDEELQADVERSLLQVGGKPLSEIILEQRGPKI
jgi:hypothetical protein